MSVEGEKSLRIKTEKGFIEIFIPIGFKEVILNSKEYEEFRKKLVNLIGAKK